MTMVTIFSAGRSNLRAESAVPAETAIRHAQAGGHIVFHHCTIKPKPIP